MLAWLLYNKYLKAFLFLCLLCCCFSNVKAQYFSLDTGRNRVTIPFRFRRNLVIVQLKINNKGPFNFILDTGVGQMVITEPSMVDSINLASKRTVKISGFGEGEDFEAFITSQLNITMPGLESHFVSAAILKKDLFGLSGYAGMPIHGLLGNEFFSRLCVKIDFADSSITVVNPGKFSGFRNGSKIPISIESGRPYIETTVTCDNGTETTRKLIVDLGAGHAMSLENVTDKRVYSQQFIAGNLGVGLKGLISGYLGRIKAIDLGKYKLKDLIASFPEDSTTKLLSVPRDGNLGVDLLKKFVVVFDYTNGSMYLKPSSCYNDPFVHDMSGLEYYAAGAGFSHVVIESVEPGSPGELAGLVKDDEIVAINFKPVSNMTLEQIDELFRSKENRTLLLKIYHDQNFTTVLTLKKRI